MPLKIRRNTGVYTAPWERSFDKLLTPLELFIHRQTTSGILLMICAVVALIIANSQWGEQYAHFFHTSMGLSFGNYTFSLTVHHWINEALMALFFMVMGLELKREFIAGELASPKQALLPIMAAIGGMALPALVYFAINPDGAAAKGWGIPMATDIAFAIGALSLLGARIPKSLLTFLIALAIVDDLGAVAVIALFYTAELNFTALITAAGLSSILIALNLGGVRRTLPYILVGIFVWIAMLASGIHATIAGIVIAFAIPMRPKYDPEHFIMRVRGLTTLMERSHHEAPDIIRNNSFRSKVTALVNGANLAQAPAQRLEHVLHLPVAYLVIPIFALANAGVAFEGDLADSLSHPITLGIISGLILGKLVGIAGFAWVSVKLGWASLPSDLNWRHVIGVGFLGGIGFTMSIFIADLGFAGSPENILQAKVGILLGSLVAGILGIGTLLMGEKSPNDQTDTGSDHANH